MGGGLFCCGASPQVRDEVRGASKPVEEQSFVSSRPSINAKKGQVVPVSSSPSKASLLQSRGPECSFPSATTTTCHPFAVPTSGASITSRRSNPANGELLREMGFQCYSTGRAPSSKVPSAILVLEPPPGPDLLQPPNQPVRNDSLKLPEEGRVSLQTMQHRSKPVNNLMPAYVNKACCSLFGIRDHTEYVLVIRRLLQRDPLLTFALQKGLRNLKLCEDKPVSHVTPDPSGQTSTLFGMRITPCVWDTSQSPQAAHSSTCAHPALLIEHNVPYDATVVMPRLMRDYAVLSHVPAILTLIDFNGRTIWQNASSLAYMGDLLSVKHDNPLADSLLQALFMYNMSYLDQLLEEVSNGQEWQGVVQVPCNLRHSLAATARQSALLTDEPHVPHVPSAATPSAAEETDVEFQIGADFSTLQIADKHKRAQQKQVANFLGGRHINTQQSNIVRLHSHVPGQPPSISSPSIMALEPPGPVSVPLTSLAYTDLTPMPSGHSAPALPSQNTEHSHPRRFMTLLDKATQPKGIQSRQSADQPDMQDPHHCASEPSGMQVVSRQGSQTMGGPHEAQEVGHVEGEEGEYDEAAYGEEDCYHEIHAIPLLDPVLDKQVIMLLQTDVTPRVELENKLANLTDAQLSMLEQLFPRHIIEYMLARVPSQGGRNLRDLVNTHDQVMVLFCDVVGFTSMSKEVEARQVMHFLNELYEVFDELVGDYDMYKLDIIGDGYIAVAGLIKEDQDGFVCVDEMDSNQVVQNAERIMEFAKAMLAESRPVVMPHDGAPVQLRIGIHTGPLVSGLVGAKMPKFTLVGDTMNTASRMESTCRPGCIHVTDAFARLLPAEKWESTGGTHVKGKGVMQTYLYVPQGSANLQSARSAETEHGMAQSTGKRTSMSRMASFTSRMMARSPSMDSHMSNAGNPLLTILHNILGEDEGRQPLPLPPVANQARSSTEASQNKSGFLAPVFSMRHAKLSPSKQCSEMGGDGGGPQSPSKPMRRRPSEGFALRGQKSRRPSDMRYAPMSKSIAMGMLGQSSTPRQGTTYPGYSDEADSLLPHKVALALTGGSDYPGELNRSSRSGSASPNWPQRYSVAGSLRQHSQNGSLMISAVQELAGLQEPRRIRKRSDNSTISSSPLRGVGPSVGDVSRAASNSGLLPLPGLLNSVEPSR